MINVLVFPCGSEIGLEIHAALKFCKDVCLFGAASVSDHGEYLYARYAQINAHASGAGLADELNRLTDEWRIDIILPAHDSVMLRLAQLREQLIAKVATPELEVAQICRNKNLTYDAFEASFIPRRVEGLAERYPIFAKPAVGQGSNGVQRIDAPARHAELIASGIEYVFAEYLPGREYTVDCLSDRHGGLLHLAPRERIRVKAGISVRTRPVPVDDEIRGIADVIATRLAIPGAWFFQIKIDAEGRYKLLEIAPRISGSMGLSRCLGVNFSLLTLYAYLNREFAVIEQQYPIEMDRALQSRFKLGIEYRRVYLDLDDTLIVAGRVNPVIVMLLYQWAAASIPVVLVTRHNREPRATLEAFRLHSGLVTEVVHIRDESCKSAVIDPSVPSIFIDDAYRERLDVARTHGIPVFDVDAAEQLLEWRS